MAKFAYTPDSAMDEFPEESLLDGASPRGAEDVREEKDPQGSENVAAGRTTSETWFPASCV